MNRKVFIIVFISVNLFFVFFMVYKNTTMVKLSYEKQHLEKEKQKLVKQKEELQQSLCMAQNRSAIKKFAHDTLAMEKIKLDQITVLSDENKL